MSESCDLKDGRGDSEKLMVVKKVSRGQNWGGTLSWHDNFHALPVVNATIDLSCTDVSVMNIVNVYELTISAIGDFAPDMARGDQVSHVK